VTLKEEDFEKVKIESTHSIEITDFVEHAQINPKFFYKPYFLEPQKGGEKSYALLHRALSDTSRGFALLGGFWPILENFELFYRERVRLRRKAGLVGRPSP
jgi:hypothetical protein